MSDHRDPKVTKTGDKKRGGGGKWIGVALAVLVALLLLGWFGGEEPEVETADPALAEEPEVVEEPVTEEPAVEEPELVEDPEVTDEPDVVDEPDAIEEPEFVE